MVYLSIYLQYYNPFKIQQLELLHVPGCWSYDPNPKKNALNYVYKSKNGRNFQFTKFSFIDFFLTDRRSLSGKRLKSASGKSFSCRFSFSAERNANTKATEYVHSSTRPSGSKGKWCVSSWLAISTDVKKYDIFSRVLSRLFSVPEIPV